MSATKPFRQRLAAREAAAESLLCVGLDPVLGKLPRHLPRSTAGVTEFLIGLVDATRDLVSCYKPNLPFYLALGPDGISILQHVREAIPADIPMVLDCKVNDLGDTARAWAQTAFDLLEADAIVVNPYMGEDALSPYVTYDDKGVIVLVKTSNSGFGDVQDLRLADGQPLYAHIAAKSVAWDAQYPAAIGMVVGATHPEQLAQVRRQCPDTYILLPGIGAQGGDVQQAISAGADAAGGSLLCSSSRSIMYASDGEDFAEAARAAAIALRNEINRYRSLGVTS